MFGGKRLQIIPYDEGDADDISRCKVYKVSRVVSLVRFDVSAVYSRTSHTHTHYFLNDCLSRVPLR